MSQYGAKAMAELGKPYEAAQQAGGQHPGVVEDEAVAGAQQIGRENRELTGEVAGEAEGCNRLVRFSYQGIFLEVL